ncbi:hypothetical protein BDW62DRAFT_174489 [Aspergillus aurantiobrunneus]
MTDYASPPAGYALRRNGTCLDTEEFCDNPWEDWHFCCPGGSYCSEDRNVCCRTQSGCAAVVERDPHCANNETWDLFNNDGDYFCCLHGKQAFVETFPNNGGQGIGCADGELDNASQSLLNIVATGAGFLSPTSSPSPSPTPTDTETPTETNTPAPAAESDSNAGPIAGGVVGGCAGVALIVALAWFLLRRRRKKVASVTSPNAGVPGEEQKSVYGGELGNNPVRMELSGSPGTMAHELPVDSRQ